MTVGTSAYMVQLSNGSLQNGLISADQLKRALKINLLFFDEVHVSAPALLRNDVLNELSLHGGEPEALKRIHHEFIRPVLLDRNGSIGKVAHAVANSNLKIGFHRHKGRGSPIVGRQSFEQNDLEQLHRHAEFINSARPTYQYARSNFEQRDFIECYLQTVERYASISKGTQSLLFSDLAKRLAVESRNVSNFRVVDVINVLDKARSEIEKYPARMYTKACSMAFLTMEWLAAPTEGDEFSTSKTASFLVDEIENAHSDVPVGDETDLLQKPKPTSLIIEFPILKLLRLPLLEVLKVRELPLFKELRVALGRYRQSWRPEEYSIELLRLFRAAGDFLHDYLSQDQLQREITIANEKDKWKHVVIKRWGFSGIAISAIGVEAAAINKVRALDATWDSWVDLAATSIVPIIGFAVHRSESRQKRLALLTPRSQSENRRSPGERMERWDIVRGQVAGS
jgi:hypothetical protein